MSDKLLPLIPEGTLKLKHADGGAILITSKFEPSTGECILKFHCLALVRDKNNPSNLLTLEGESYMDLLSAQ